MGKVISDAGQRRVLSRRSVLKLSGLGALSVTMADWLSLSEVFESAASGQTTLEPLNRFPRMVQEYFVRRVRETEDAAEKVRGELATKADAVRYVDSVQRRIDACFGPWPEKTPLNPRVTGKVERDTYHIENIVFESRPGFLVTGNLYVPKGRPFPLPGVVGVCGHSANGKAAEAYQSFAQGLARLGYVVFIIDPISQGERSQYYGANGKHSVGLGVNQHLHAGNQQFLVGEFIGSWRAWDGMRALDYLLTRGEVDPKHLGITGNSGGGTMSTWLCGVERRWTMGAPSCFVTTFRRNLENELPADTEQCPPRALALGLDHSDFLAAMAPKPVIILSKERDFFDVRGAQESFARLKRLYSLLGVEKNIGLFVGPTYHGYSQENREAMYRWFNGVTGISDARTEPALTIEKDEALYCAPGGQVANLKSKTVQEFTREKAAILVTQRSLSSYDLFNRVRRVLRMPAAHGAPDYRILRQWTNRDFPAKSFTTYAVETEPGIQAVVYRLDDERIYSRPPQGKTKAVLYVSHQSSDAELRQEPLVKEVFDASKDADFFACDVRGIGESQPDTANPNSFLSPYGSDFLYAIHALMLDAPYLGQKTHDVLRVIDWLAASGLTEVHLVAKGWGALPGALAAFLSPNVKQVTLKNALSSYQEVAEAEHYNWPLSCLLPNVLAHFDLPECYAQLAAKGLKQIEPWGPKAG